MKFHVTFPRQIAEQTSSELTVPVEAETLEDAVISACKKYFNREPHTGDKMSVRVNVEVLKKTKLPLKSTDG